MTSLIDEETAQRRAREAMRARDNAADLRQLTRPLDPSSWRGRISAFLAMGRNLLSRGRFSSLTRRIVVFNVVGLFVLVGGILYLNQFREGLIDARRQSLLTQAEIIAGAIAQSATTSSDSDVIDPLSGGRFAVPLPPEGDGSDARQKPELILPIIPENAAPILRRLVVPTQTRARLYDKDGWLILDSRRLTASGQIIAFELPPPEDADERGIGTRILDWLSRLLPGQNLERFRDAGSQNGTIYDEVKAALSGLPSSQERINDRGELIVSVAVPIQRYRAVLGALMLSTKGGDIDSIVRAERWAIVQVFFVALGVTILLSVLLAGTIAEPVRRLAEAAEIVRRGKQGRMQIPDFTERRDEIGELSGALRDMTNALYNRIDAIESFAADVAHELKNPLTSLRSAIETFRYAKDDKSKDRLMEIIQDDVKRIDRLISDISNASRLDAELSREEMDTVNIATLLETVCDLFNETGVTDSVRVKLTIEPGARGREAMIVKGFDMRLGQVIRNLIDNAISFSPPEGIVKVIAHQENGNIVIEVIDQGSGIAPENFERIFDRFHTDRPDSFGKHSGLGLAISRQIVEAHLGKITAGNDLDTSVTPPVIRGARFVVELPVVRTV
ncbi:MAG: sensor histidine kinase [Parvibaculum sp.]